MNLLKIGLVVCFFIFSGCSAILAGRTQNIMVETTPSEAACTFHREGIIIGQVNPTPGSLMVQKTKHDINVICKKEGYQEATQFLDSGIEPATFGNIALGGFIGWGVDSAMGADNKYPERISLTLPPVVPSPSVKETKK